ncbi:polyprenyl synthetase family protein [Fredinandcohnia sp. QZ13]|uniref:polyprenyl synthetase family protein n=1 Tax=Fredinandcohnia sp. QZ13 TaxID=3073144 RepID=UPI00285350EB|nr:farnesyl diphosphate synthase [Fredinandcohnia sp. QZ13]MDR4888871.1 polyprenyl synthetase family protein [Fredinandcohnia sp. QZ13]
MGLTEVEQFLDNQKKNIEEQLPTYISHLSAPNIIKDAMHYSLEAGGKRIRPLLLLGTLHSFGKDEGIGIPTACAIEMIHTYSLIHDDLPSMDDDDLRRGKPTNHKVFGEAIAILAGDALLTYSFQIISETMKDQISPEKKLLLITELAKASGPEGMVGGQVADMKGEGAVLNLEELEYIHRHKTGKLLAYSVIAGAILADATSEQLEKLTQFAHHLGLAFQIRDDILDIEGTEVVLGKPVGSDTGNHKNTYPALLTLEGAKEKLTFHIDEAKRFLYSVDMKHDILDYMCNLIASRDH